MSVALASSSTRDPARHEPLRVMVVDDSVVIRGLIGRWIEAEPDMVVAASLRTGLDAVNQVERVNPDVAVLDIEMPDLDGIAALPQLLGEEAQPRHHHGLDPDPPQRGDQFQGAVAGRLRLHPETRKHPRARRRRNLSPRPDPEDPPSRRKSSPPGAGRKPAAGADARAVPVPGARPALAPVAHPQLLRRAFSTHPPRALLIGASTGGPQALMALVSEIGPVIDRFPVLITQHMPPTFTTILAEHLARASHRPAHEGVDGELVKPGRIYLAPGGRHMRVVRNGANAAIALDDGPPVNFCKPAVDPLFASAIEVWQGGILAVVLTGMGSDGMRGGREIVAAGGSVIAQDEATSVVWGMPGAATHAGICAAVLPLGQIAPKLIQLFAGVRS